MNWKKFLKPDKRKIVLTLILSLFVFFINYEIWLSNSAVIGISGEEYCCGRGYKGPFVIYENGTVERLEGCDYYNLEVCQRLEKEKWLQIVYFYSIVIISNYLISCLIVWIYDKFRKSKK
jgi:hypothetical protein